MEPVFALKRMKNLVKKNQFLLVKRRAKHATPVSKELAKIIVSYLSIKDFIKEEEDKQYPNTYVWIYETTYGSKYYIKFKFKNEGNIVVFISFHETLY